MLTLVFFHQKFIKKLHFGTFFSNSFVFYWLFVGWFNQQKSNFDDVDKTDYFKSLWNKGIWNKVYDWNYTLDMVIWPILVTSVSTRVVSITSVTMLLAILTHFKLCWVVLRFLYLNRTWIFVYDFTTSIMIRIMFFPIIMLYKFYLIQN